MWLADFVKPVREPSTYANYEQMVRLRLKPAIGGVRLRKLSAGQIQRMYADMLGEGQRKDKQKSKTTISPSTVNRCHRVLRAALERAIKLGYITVNPAKATAPPQMADFEPVVVDDDQAERFLEAAQGHRLYALFEMALFTGLREGELLALTWGDVDLDRCTAYVAKALKDVPGMPVFVGRTKSKAGRRTILLPDRTVEALRRHRRAQAAEKLAAGADYRDTGLVFCRPDGTFLPPTAMPKLVRRICRKAGLAPMRFHDLRHSHGTMLDADNTDPRTIAERLGHADPAFTMRTYTHATVRMQRAPVERINRRLRRAARRARKTPENASELHGS
jgi:integrase